MDARKPLMPDQPTVADVRSAYTQIWHTARRYLSGRIAGRFCLLAPLSEGGTPLTLAAGIAGAASLTIETSTDAIRAAVREGAVDFAVNTLDEALRILKNEIRKQQAASVLLEGDVSQVLAEAADRGAQPDLIAWPPSHDRRHDRQHDRQHDRLAPFLARGAVLLPFSGAEDAPRQDVLDPDREGWLSVRWKTSEPAAQALRYLDGLAASALPDNDLERRYWIARAPRYLPRAQRSERSLSMSPDEAARFRSAVEHAIAAGELSTGAELQVGQQSIRIPRPHPHPSSSSS